MNKKTFLLVSLVLFSFALFAQTSTKTNVKNDSTNDKVLNLDIDTAVLLALKSNLGIESARLTLEQKKWAIITSWNIFVPTVSLDTTFSRVNKLDRELKAKCSFISYGTCITGTSIYGFYI